MVYYVKCWKQKLNTEIFSVNLKEIIMLWMILFLKRYRLRQMK